MSIPVLTEEQFRIYRRCMNDPFYFSNFVYIIHPVRGKVKFDLYEYQRAVLWEFLNQRFNIILKFRQAGLTELIAMYCLWLAMYHDNKNVQIISIKDRVAKRVLKRIKYMYRNLPEWLRTPVPNQRGGEIGTQTDLEFSNGSIITSVPTTEEAGRSEAVSLLVIDEAAIVRWANQIWAAAFPTLSCAKGNTPIFLRTYEEIKKGHPKPITEVVKLKDLCPKKKGVLDISDLNYHTLTHTGQWKKILWSQNKGKLETWDVKDRYGKKGGYTPKHRLFTTSGWKTIEEIIENNLNVISVDTKVKTLKKIKSTKKPDKEVIKPIEDFPGFFVSNLGKVYGDSQRRGFYELPQRKNKDGYLRVGLRKPGVYRDSGDKINRGKSKTFQRSVHGLVAEAFLGKKPDNYQIDHLDNIRDHNWVTNLRYLPVSDNTSRSYEYSLNAVLTGIQGDKLPDLLRRGKILEMAEEGFSYREIAREVYPGYKQAHKFVKRILTERGSRVYISKLTVIKKSLKTIYDIHVEDDHSYISANNYINHNTGGSAILNSTPYGVGNFFHKQWVDAKAKASYFNPIRLYWQMHPERDQMWYDTMKQSLGVRRTAQEIDGDFLTSGNTVFDLNDIRAIEDSLPMDDDYYDIRENGRLYIKRKPKLNELCFIGADVAIGRSNDFSAFPIHNRQGEELGYFKGKIAPGQFAKLLMKTGKEFNRAIIAPESNDIGLAVTSLLQEHGYPNLYYSKQLLKKKGKNKPKEEDIPGWYTTASTRPIIIDELEEDVRNDNVDLCNKFFVDEAYTFIYDSRNRPIAMGKDRVNSDDLYEGEDIYTDDSIMAEAITNYIRKGKKFITTNPI